MQFEKFVAKLPHRQNALDIFEGRWASQIPSQGGPLRSGDALLFTDDPRPNYAAKAFGDVFELLDGQNVLELGPLEGGHTFQLERLGANVTAIEGNAEAYLKCLIVKETLGLKSRFFLGDFVQYLEKSTERYDLIFASGVLYHMTHPAEVIDFITQRTDRCFVWMHYCIPGQDRGREEVKTSYKGLDLDYFKLSYGESTEGGRFWGGLESSASWMTKDGIRDTFNHFGFDHFEVMADEPTHQNGPSFSFVASRTRP